MGWILIELLLPYRVDFLLIHIFVVKMVSVSNLEVHTLKNITKI